MALVTTWNYTHSSMCGCPSLLLGQQFLGRGVFVHLGVSWVNESGAQERGVVFLAGGGRGG